MCIFLPINMNCNLSVEFYIIRKNDFLLIFLITKVFDPMRLWLKDLYLLACVIDIPLYPINM